MSEGALVWAYGVKIDESSGEVHILNAPCVVHRASEDGVWTIEDTDRRFGMEFIRGGDGGDNEPCIDKFEGGFLSLFAVEKIVPAKKKILIVDDDAMVLRALVRVFQEHYEVTTATNGAIAVALIKEHEFAVVLSDVDMPVMLGTELRQWVAENKPSLLPTFALHSGQDYRASLPSNAIFFSKPCGAKQIVKIIADAIAIKEGASSCPPSR